MSRRFGTLWILAAVIGCTVLVATPSAWAGSSAGSVDVNVVNTCPACVREVRSGALDGSSRDIHTLSRDRGRGLG